ncbi:MAG: hypothetical protein JNJ54_26965 [Myxococcaceae bacterium]|nr:hypothetical protein [Myxococcaceae bacterium]
MRLGAAAGVVSVLLSQAPEPGESLGAVLARVQARWTHEALQGEPTLLAYDRGVVVLAERATALKGRTTERLLRVRALEAAVRTLASVPLEDLTGEGTLSHLRRLELAEKALDDERSAARADCLRALVTLAELRGRVEGKLDSLSAARRSCATDAGVGPAICSSVLVGEAVFGELLGAVTREQAVLEAQCSGGGA